MISENAIITNNKYTWRVLKVIKEIEFENFRNLEGKYIVNQQLIVIVGENNSGKSNLLDGIRLAFSSISFDYFKIKKSDFKNSDDNKTIKIKVKMENDDIPSLLSYDEHRNQICGFTITISKSNTNKYFKRIFDYNENKIDYDILREDMNIPKLYMIPLIRTEDLYSEWLRAGISSFIESEDAYMKLKKESKTKMFNSMADKICKFKEFTKKFNQDLGIALTEPKIIDEKVYIVSGEEEHNYCIGSGYKSIANIILNTMEDRFNIILIDEIENHLHPSLLRTLLKEIKKFNAKAQIIATTHSPIVINELLNDELLFINKKKLTDIDDVNLNKLERFMTPGRSELIFGENIVLIEGVTEELLLKNYIKKYNKNWTIINVAGIMFEPYIELGKLLDKKIVVISDNDIALSDSKSEASSRFLKLKEYCEDKNIKILNTFNTLESDLFKNGFLNGYVFLLTKIDKTNIYIAKNGKKTLIAEQLINDDVDLSNWHIIKELNNEFGSN